jgi:hypothetical protein
LPIWLLAFLFAITCVVDVQMVHGCRNPSIRLATKARRLRGCGPRSRPGSHITRSRECKESRECEGMNPHTPKWTPMLGVAESWSPKRTPETSESNLRGQISMACCAIYINGKLLKRRCLKWARIAHLDIWNISYDQKKGRESNSRESVPGVCQFGLPTTKSRESTRNTWLQTTCDISLESFRRELQLCFRSHFDPRSARKVMGLQNPRSPAGRDFGTPGRESREKEPFGCSLRGASQRIL